MLDKNRPMIRCGNDARGAVAKRARARKAGLLAAAIAAAISLQANALSVVPGTNSFGTSTPAGRGGAVHRVTNLNETGTGSLKACIDATGPRACVFEVSGTIRLTRDLVIRNPFITIAGQTAPSPGIMLRGAGLWIAGSDVLVQHIRVRVGDDTTGPAPDNRDALKIDNSSAAMRNVVIDHCSFSWSVDEMASAWGGWDNVTLMNSIFAEPLHDSLHSKGPHGYGVLFGPRDANAAMLGNLLANMVERNPLTNATRAVIVNNVIYNWRNMAVDLQSQSGLATNNTVVGNVFIRGADYNTNPPVVLRANVSKLPAGSKVYLDDNIAQEATSDPWSIAGPYPSSYTIDLDSFKASSPTVWPSGMLRLPGSDNATLNHVLRYAGARPADRDSVDRRIVEGVRNRTGRIINCVSANGTARCQRNAGGWPTLAQNRRTLTLPESPNTVTASGYTNLEIWLHRMAAEIEGRSPTPPLPPVLKN